MRLVIFLILFLFHCLPLSAGELSDYQRVKCIIHIHTDISSGTRSIESYVKEAKEKGIGVIVLTDEDWRRWEYGLPPFRRLIKKAIEKKSVMTFGIERYLNVINKINEKNKDIIIIDGVQTNPFYFWSGNLLKGTLTINNRNKDMLVIGLGSAKNYRDMPSVTNHKSRFNAYSGDNFTEPYQDLIDYVIERNGLIFWSHPEFQENTEKDKINLLTVPYHWDLVGTYNYTGFGIFWEGYEKIGRPMGIWDRVLTEYCQGKRNSPIWAMGELEEEGLGNKNLDDIVNVIYVKNLSRHEILNALKKGRLYVIFKVSNRIPLVLEEFSISDELGTITATMAEEISFAGEPVIKVKISHEQPIKNEIVIKLVRNNKVIKEFSANSQIEIEYKDTGLAKNQKYYYRLDVVSGGGYGRLISNPIFFRRTSDK